MQANPNPPRRSSSSGGGGGGRGRPGAESEAVYTATTHHNVTEPGGSLLRHPNLTQPTQEQAMQHRRLPGHHRDAGGHGSPPKPHNHTTNSSSRPAGPRKGRPKVRAGADSKNVRPKPLAAHLGTWASPLLSSAMHNGARCSTASATNSRRASPDKPRAPQQPERTSAKPRAPPNHTSRHQRISTQAFAPPPTQAATRATQPATRSSVHPRRPSEPHAQPRAPPPTH